jgi:tetratricopeptide (TPR) repeat protein
VLRLAELYTQQGLFNDARAQYLQVAEDFLKSGQTEQAIRIFQKTLEMDPDNVPMRVRLAEAYIHLGKKDDAWQLLTAAAENLRSKGQLAAADELLKRMLKLDPENSYARVLRGRAAAEKGDYNATIQCLAKVADLDNNAEGLRALFQAYLHTNRIDDATALAAKLANVHDDVSSIFECGTALAEGQRAREAVQLYEQFADRLLRTDSAKLFESLRALLHYIQDDPQTMEKVLAIFQKGGDSTQLTDIYELLAHGYVQSGNLEKARDYYLKLTELEPANQMHATNYQQVTEQLGSVNLGHVITAEEGAGMMDELEANAPFVEQRYDDDVALALKAALTDAELFMSYNMPAKALDPLIAALPSAPRDLRLNQRLAALHTRAGRFAEAAVCCRTLESIYHDAGHADEASKYSDLAAKYEQRSAPAGGKSQANALSRGKHAAAATVQEFEIAAPVSDSFSEAPPGALTAERAPHDANASSAHSGLFFQEPTQSAQAEPQQEFSIAPPHPAAETGSAEDWEQDFSIETPHAAGEPVSDAVHASAEEIPAPTPEAPANLDESIEEVRFYLGQGMTEQAELVLAKLEAMAPGAPELAVLRAGIDSAKQTPGSSAMEQGVSLDESDTLEAPPHAAEHEPAAHLPEHPQPWPSERPVLDESIFEAEPSLAESVDAPAAHTQPVVAPVPAQAAKKFNPGTLDEFVADLEASLGNDFIPEAPAPSPAPVAPLPHKAPEPILAIPAPKVAAPSEVPATRAAAASVSPSTAEHSKAPIHTPVSAAHTSAPPQRFDPASSVDLSTMFGELKQELEHDAASADEDPETHYNLGVAFREMGLLDEAIGEL